MSVTSVEQRALAAMRVKHDGAALLCETREFIRRFVSFPSDECLTATTLWAAHAHCIGAFYTTPRLALLSPEPESGKTRVLEVLNTLVPDSMFTVNPSPATIFRTLHKGNITLLIDECDAIFTKKGKDDNNEDLRGLLNAGYKRGAQIPRCVGNRHEVEMFPVYCPVVLAGLGDLPETIMSRSVIIRMRPRADEQVESFYMRDHEHLGHAMRDRLTTWAEAVHETVALMRPAMPAGVVDRAREAWEPLIAMADAAGGDWPALARLACSTIHKARASRVSLGVRLLGELRIVFSNEDAMHTKEIIGKLCDPDASGLEADAPWAELNGGKPITERGLASILRRYNVAPVKVKRHGTSLQGYRREHLGEPWKRYLPSSSAKAESTEPPEPSGRRDGEEGSGRVPDVPDKNVIRNQSFNADALKVPQVPDVPDVRGVGDEVVI